MMSPLKYSVSIDSLACLFQETRQQRPPIWDADAWQSWLAAMAQVLGAFHDPARRWAAMVLVADDLMRSMPGLAMGLAYGTIEEAVRQGQKERPPR